MKISFDCNGCGKSYSVKPEMAGRQAKCKQCGTVIIVPKASIAQSPESSSAPGTTSRPSQSHTIPTANHPAVARGDRDPSAKTQTPTQSPASTGTNKIGNEKKIMNAFPTDAAKRGLETATPNLEHRTGDTYTSNPGNIKVSKLRYVTVYPKWFFIWHSLLIVTGVLCWYSLWFIPLFLFIVYCLWLYWSRISAQFMHGCTNPSQVVSLTPPLIATYTDMTKGGPSFPVIKVDEQPIHKMSTGKPKVGQKLATIALYEDRFPISEHWSSFDPKPVACVSSNQREIQEVMDSIDKEDWDFLASGIAQLPKPIKPGHYRIYEQRELTATAPMQPAQVRRLVNDQLGDIKYVSLAGEFSQIDPEKLKEASEYVPSHMLQEVWCLIESGSLSAGCKMGMAFTSNEIYYNFKETGKGQIQFTDIAAGFSSNTGLEILTRDGRRTYFHYSSFMGDVLDQLDTVFDSIAGRTE